MSGLTSDQEVNQVKINSGKGLVCFDDLSTHRSKTRRPITVQITSTESLDNEIDTDVKAQGENGL